MLIKVGKEITISCHPLSVAVNPLLHIPDKIWEFSFTDLLLSPTFFPLMLSRDNINGTHDLTRRQAVTGLGATIATVAFTPVSAIAGTQSTGKMAAKLEDPTTKYPKPPFKYQPQPWPGLQSKMDPVPDCGEKSYKGSDRLSGRRALITGGDSGMGRAAAIAFAREGADVVINYYPTEEPDAQEVIALIRAAGRKGFAIPGDLRDEAFCKQLVNKAIAQMGGLDIIVNNAGRQQASSSILDISTDDFDSIMKTNIYAPFWIIREALQNWRQFMCSWPPVTPVLPRVRFMVLQEEWGNLNS